MTRRETIFRGIVGVTGLVAIFGMGITFPVNAQSTEHPTRLPYTYHDVDGPFERLYRIRTTEGADCYVLQWNGHIQPDSMSCVKVMHITNGYTDQPL